MVATDSALYIPTPRQAALWERVAEAALESLTLLGYGGAAGGGKTRAIAELAIDFALTYPGTRILLARKDFSDLSTTLMEEFYRAIHPRLIQRRHGSEHWCDVGVSGASVARVYFGELKDWLSLGSEQYGMAGIDEAGEVPEQSMLMLLTRMREPHAAKRVIVCGSNPWPGWFKRWFVDRSLPEDALREVGARVHFIPAYISDNPHLPQNYEQTLRLSLPRDWVDRFVEGRWDAFEGQVFTALSTRHVWRGVLPEFTRLFGGLDFGGANPQAHRTAGLLGGVTRNNHHIYLRAFERAGPRVYDELLDWIDRAQRDMGGKALPIHWRGDKSQMFGLDLLRRSGLAVALSHGGADSVQAGIGLINRRLADGTAWYTPELLDALEPGGQSWYQRMEAYRWPEQPSSDRAVPLNPIKRDDDVVDATRYAVEEADGYPTSTGRSTTMAGRVLA